MFASGLTRSQRDHDVEASFSGEGEEGEEEGDDVVLPTPAIINAIMSQPRNTPTLNLIDKVSSEVRKSPAMEKSRLQPVVNAAPIPKTCS